VGFDSKGGFTEMDKNRDVVNGIRVEMMELKPVVVKEATEKRTRGERFTENGKMYDFVNIFHGERFAE
jgi:hypothetical protein